MVSNNGIIDRQAEAIWILVTFNKILPNYEITLPKDVVWALVPIMAGAAIAASAQG